MGASVSIVPVPYEPNVCSYFGRLRVLPGAVLLDSARPFSTRGRFDLLAAEPLCMLETRGDTTLIHERDRTRSSLDAPLALLDRCLESCLPEPASPLGEWPFAGGAIGCFGYELGRRQQGFAPRASGTGMPDMYAGIYGWALMQDHERRRSALLFGRTVDEAERERVLARVLYGGDEAQSAFSIQSAFDSGLSRRDYAAAFERIQRYIRAGDCYQVNLAQRLAARASGDPWHVYRRLRERMASPFSAFMRTPGGTVLSFSPERFLQLSSGRVETRPIKGTARRVSDASLDRQIVAELLASEKNRAENIMIVDLLRNDLAKACALHSVRVEKLCSLESYANVHHLVSVVSGQLREGVSALQLLGHCFPGGSITGAPKRRAMQIIDELEPDPRDIYCGSIAYVSRGGNMDSSITIRTLVANDGAMYAWGGGGIVADSEAESEYSESLLKIQPLMNALIENTAEPDMRFQS